jgi:AmmeMemoRadiSam system protein B
MLPKSALILDQTTAHAIEASQAEQLDGDQACGFRPIRGLLHLARERDLSTGCIDLRNSGDTAGRRDRVVGYGAFVFMEQDGPRSIDRSTILSLKE